MTERRSRLKDRGTSLAELAEHLQLTKGTISAVLNDSPYAKSIPQHTKDRIIAAATELNYRPNFFARTLRKKRTYSIGIVCAEIGDPYGSMVISGIESELSRNKYFFLTAIPRHDPILLNQYVDLLMSRGVEGIITVDTSLTHVPSVPTAAVPGHSSLTGITNIVLDHDHAAEQALKHLYELGHRDIAVFRGQPQSTDSDERWRSVSRCARELGIPIKQELTYHLQGEDPSPQLGYIAMRELMARGKHFTALFAYNDISAIGAIRALREKGFQVPQDVSVVGFDDIREAAFHFPGITTVRQPLRKMGETAAKHILQMIESGGKGSSRVDVEPEFVIRESTGPAPRALKIRSFAD
jgi:DNA-binding LacI/PurR family transcriptional regulator